MYCVVSIIFSLFSFTYILTYLLDKNYFIPYAFGATASTRASVSNELGAGNPHAAKVTVCAVMVLAVAEMTVVCTSLLSYRHCYGSSY
ncbi:hypothetical protein ACFX1S_020111 [Malus domestica]